MILQKRIKYFLFFYLSVSYLSGFAQSWHNTPRAFGLYLKKNELHRDELTLINKLIVLTNDSVCLRDSLLLRKAALELILNDTATMFNSINKISYTCAVSLKNEKLFTSILIQPSIFKTNYAQGILNSINDSSQWHKDLSLSTQMLNRKALSTNSKDQTASIELQQICERYRGIKPRSPFLAGLFSAIVPGSGKWYIGQTNHFLTSLATNFILGAQAGEGLVLSGANSFHFIATCSLFGVYYLGNIWGSYAAAKKQKRDAYNEIDYEIYRLYTNRALELSR